MLIDDDGQMTSVAFQVIRSKVKAHDLVIFDSARHMFVLQLKLSET